MCESRSGRPGLHVPRSPYGLCGRKATLNLSRAQEVCESRGGLPGLHVPHCPYGLCGRRVTLNSNSCRLIFFFFFFFFNNGYCSSKYDSKTTTKSMGILKFSSSAFDIFYLLDNICFLFFYFFIF